MSAKGSAVVQINERYLLKMVEAERTLATAIKVMKNEREDVRDSIRKAIGYTGEEQFIEVGSHQVEVIVAESDVFDEDRFSADHPKMYEKYTKVKKVSHLVIR